MIIGVVLAVILTFNTEPERPPDTDWTGVFGPVVIEGWRYTPSEFVAWIIPDPVTSEKVGPKAHTSPWLGFDNSMLLESANGSRFDFGGFDSIGLQNGPGVVTSSNGHTLHYVTLRHMARHYQVHWEDVDWVRWDFHDFQHWEGAVGFDNVVVSIDEPSTGLLLMIGLGGLGIFSICHKYYFARHY